VLWEKGSTRSEICLSQWRTQARRGELPGCSLSQIQISKETPILQTRFYQSKLAIELV